MKLLSPAKCNLFFRVLRKREDGFHEIASLMQKLDLSDEIEFFLSDRDLLTCDDPTIPTDERNLVHKARDLFRLHTGINFQAEIHLKKNIPAEAGLGGGSSNAATTLSALNQAFGCPLSRSDLMQLGAQIGSDVPFFFTSGVAYATGRGEILEEVPMVPLTLTIHKPDYGLSTKEVYQHTRVMPGPDPDRLVKAFLKGEPTLINDLERAAFSLKPELKAFKETLGPCAVMTGSGTAFIAISD